MTTSAIGMQTSRRAPVTATTTIGSQTVTFTGIEKLITVYRLVGTKYERLQEITADDMIIEHLIGGSAPTKFAVERIYPTSADIKINLKPTAPFTLYADAMVTVGPLVGNTVPQFPESFHDILVHGVKSLEYAKMEKAQLSQQFDAKYKERLSDLRFWIAKTAWLDTIPGINNENVKWWETPWSKV